MASSPFSPEQDVVDGVVEALDAHASMTAMTGLERENVLPLDRLSQRADRTRPALGVEHGGSSPDGGAVGDWREHQLDLVAEAASLIEARALMYLAESLLTTLTLSQNARTPLDARVTDWVNGPSEYDPKLRVARVTRAVSLTVHH